MLPRRLLSLSLAVALAVTATSQVSPARRVKAEAALSNPRMVADASMVSGGVVTWDCVVWELSTEPRRLCGRAAALVCLGAYKRMGYKK